METHDPFGAKWITFCYLKVRNYIMIANIAGSLKVAPLRMQRGLTQKEYAKELGIPPEKLKRWEQGKVQISKSTWERYFREI